MLKNFEFCFKKQTPPQKKKTLNFVLGAPKIVLNVFIFINFSNNIQEYIRTENSSKK